MGQLNSMTQFLFLAEALKCKSLLQQRSTYTHTRTCDRVCVGGKARTCWVMEVACLVMVWVILMGVSLKHFHTTQSCQQPHTHTHAQAQKHITVKASYMQKCSMCMKKKKLIWSLKHPPLIAKPSRILAHMCVSKPACIPTHTHTHLLIPVVWLWGGLCLRSSEAVFFKSSCLPLDLQLQEPSVITQRKVCLLICWCNWICIVIYIYIYV